jgi:TPR repeat protein
MMLKKMSAALAVSVLLMAQHAHADFAAGMQAYKSKDYATALSELKPQAEAGNNIAQNIVGVMYMNALGVPNDDAEAMKWFRLAANNGYNVAQTNVGFLYEKGRGVAQDLAQARIWYEKAAAQGDGRATASLRMLDLNRSGPVVQRPPVTYGPASNPGAAPSTSAPNAYGELKAGTDAFKAKDYARAYNLLLPIATRGDREAQFYIGLIYRNGNERPKDINEAIRWLRLSADQEYSPAEYQLGAIYSSGNGINKDYDEAFKWLQRATNHGNPGAKALLGILPSLRRADQVQDSMAQPAIRQFSTESNTSPVNPQAVELVHLVLTTSSQPSDTSLLARVITRTFGNPKIWNERSPDWRAMVETVNADLMVISKRFDAQRGEIRLQREKTLAGIYSNTMSSSQLSELLAFYGSDAGRRFIAFHQDLNAVIADAIVDLTGKVLVSGLADPADISPLPAQEQQSYSKNADRRLMALKLSRYYRLQLAKNDSKVAMSTGNLIGIMAARYGDALDQVSTKYERSLEEFQTFSRSNAAQAEILGLAKASLVPVPAETKLNNEYLAEVASYRPKWIQIYKSTASGAAGGIPGRRQNQSL